MIEKIKAKLAQVQNLNNKVGVFFSAFDAQGVLLVSNGVIKTDRTLDVLVDSLYQGLLKKYESQIKTIVVDIVKDLQLQNDPNVLVTLSMSERGVFLVQVEGQNSGVLLPNTQGITTLQQALSAVKHKYNLSSQVSVFVFRTQRIVIS